MPRTPLVTAAIALAAIAAAPISLHFEGNEGTLEPFIVIFPLAALAAAAGLVVALRAHARGPSLVNGAAATLAAVWWIWLVTYEGG